MSLLCVLLWGRRSGSEAKSKTGLKVIYFGESTLCTLNARTRVHTQLDNSTINNHIQDHSQIPLLPSTILPLFIPGRADSGSEKSKAISELRMSRKAI